MEKIAKNKKIGILTFHASHNYGSMLQAYALQHTLQMRGYDSEIINLRTDAQKGLIKPEIEFCNLRATLSKIIKHPRRTIALQRKYSLFEHFLSNKLVCSKELHTHAEVEEYIKETGFEAVIVGSDQIWNTYCWDFDTSYLLDFPIRMNRIAYAPSLGYNPERLLDNKIDILTSAWSNFDALSTREKKGADFVHALTGKECSVVLDPTFLLDKEDYITLCDSKPLITGSYIFYYTPREEKGTFRLAQLLSQKLSCKIVVTQSYQEYVGENVIHALDCGPCEFLNVVKNASFTIGNSFHLLAFSLIFHRPFYVVSNENDSRMLNILNPIGMSNRMLYCKVNALPEDEGINFELVDKAISDQREESLMYLLQSLAYHSNY